MLRRFKNWIEPKPDSLKLLIYWATFFAYWFAFSFIWDFVRSAELQSFYHYLFFGLWMSFGWLAFQKWELIKLVFRKKKTE